MRAGVMVDLCQRGLVQLSLVITVGLSGYLRPIEMFSLQGVEIQAPALGITTHNSLLLLQEERPQRSKVGTSDNSLLLDSPWPNGIEPMLVVLACRPPSVTASGLTRGLKSFENSERRQLASGSRWCLTRSDPRGVRRQGTSPSATRSGTAPRQVGLPEIHGPIGEERLFDQNLSRIPRASPKSSYTDRSSIRGRDARAAVGGGGVSVRPPLKGVSFVDFFAGQGEMGRATRNACFAVRLWEPRHFFAS